MKAFSCGGIRPLWQRWKRLWEDRQPCEACSFLTGARSVPRGKRKINRCRPPITTKSPPTPRSDKHETWGYIRKERGSMTTDLDFPPPYVERDGATAAVATQPRPRCPGPRGILMGGGNAGLKSGRFHCTSPLTIQSPCAHSIRPQTRRPKRKNGGSLQGPATVRPITT